MSLEKVIAAIKRNKKFLITTHSNPEGDALGAELAFYGLIKAMGKKAIIVNNDDLPYGYEFLAGVNRIKKFKQNRRFDTFGGVQTPFFGAGGKNAALSINPGRSRRFDFDCFVILDCSDLRRCGDVYKLNTANKLVLNIDHHISNSKFGKINLVDPAASSCSEVIYRLFKPLGVPLNKNIALLLYVGILTDTGSFRYSNTSSFTHQVVAELLKYKIDVAAVYRQLYENKPLRELRVLNKLLETVRCSEEGKIVWFELGRKALKMKVLSFDLNERLLTFARSVKNMEVAVIFREIKNRKPEVKVNLRSRGQVDVNKVARFFGGGGHISASSCIVAGKMPQVRKKVLAKIREYLR